MVLAFCSHPVLTVIVDAFRYKVFEFLKIDGEDHFLNFTVSPAGETKTGVNNEDAKTSEVEINGVKGDAWEDKDTCLIIWIHYEHQFSLYSSTLTLDEMLKIAESVKYLKIK